MGDSSTCPSVSVVTRTKNRDILLRRAIESVLGQSFTDFQMVIVNDGGDPAVVDELCARYAERANGRISVLHQPESLGRAPAANLGITASDGEYVVIHDDDDSWHPDFLAATVGYLRAARGKSSRHGAVTGVVTRSMQVSERIVPGGEVIVEERVPYNQDLTQVSLCRLAAANRFPPISFLFKKSTYEEIGPWRSDLPVLEDWEFNLRFARHYQIGVIPSALANYHLRRRQGHGDSSNSVVGEFDLHRRYDPMLRREFLRHELRNGRPLLGLWAVLAPVGLALRYLLHNLLRRTPT